MPSSPSAPVHSDRSLLIVAFCCLAAMGEGFDLQAPGVTMPVLAPLFELTTGAGQGFLAGFTSQKSLFLAMSTFGLVFGAIIGGRAADLIGRKWVAIMSVVLFAMLSVVTGRSTSADMLLWGRFFTGLGLGGALPTLIALVAENVSLARRNTAVGVLYGSMPAGGALVSLSSYSLATPEHWRAIYYLGGLVPLLAVPGLIFGLPYKKPQRIPASDKKPSVGFALFGEGRTFVTLLLWVAFLLALITMYILLGWLPTLLGAKGLSRPDTSIVQIGFNVAGATGSVLTGILIDRPGKARTTALISLAAILSLGVLAGAPVSLGVSLLVGSLVGFTVASVQTTCYALAPSAYPTYVRGTGVGFAVAAGRIGSAIGPLLAGAMLGAGASATRVLLVMVPMVAMGGVCTWWISRSPKPADAVAPGAAPAMP